MTLSAFFILVFLKLPIDAQSISPIIGATYAPHDPHLPPASIAGVVSNTLRLNSARIQSPSPGIVRSFIFSNTSLFLSIPNSFIIPFATNISFTVGWIYGHVLPFHPRAKITLISVGEDAVSQTLTPFLLPAIRNLHDSLISLGVTKIQVSTTFSLANLVKSPFPPSSATFEIQLLHHVIEPLLEFLQATNSSFLVNIYPYTAYRASPQIPLGYALFQNLPFNFRDDVVTGVRYLNLFDMMVDSVVTSMAVLGYQEIPLVIAETGWPSCSSVAGEKADANAALAEIYLRGLVAHLRSGEGTPLRREGVAGAYIYRLTDENATAGFTRDWGILYANLSKKYGDLELSISCAFVFNMNTLVMFVSLLLTPLVA